MTYTNVTSAKPIFASISSNLRRVASTFEGSFTTPAKVQEAYRLLSETEDLCTLLRTRLSE